jgi:hypothetical protein
MKMCVSKCTDPKGSPPQKDQQQPNSSILINHPELVTLSIMCVKDIIANKKALIIENP